MTINAILACDTEGGIARKGIMPWPKNKVDLRFFSQITRNKTVVMGHNTWLAEDMPTPLPFRTNIVLSNNTELQILNATVLHSPSYSDIITLASNEDIFIIGGAGVIKWALPIIDTFLLTRIAGNWDCDTFLPLEKITSWLQLTNTTALDENTIVETYKKEI
jgi:dihydrofolate reductase